MRERFAGQREKLAGDEAEWNAYVADRTVRADKRIRQMNTGDLSQLHGPARELALREGWRLAEGSSLFRQFVERLATATLDAMTVERKQLAGEFAVEPTSPLVRGELNRVAHTAAPGEALLEQFDAYERECLRASSKRPDVLKQDRKVVEQFVAFVGADRRVDSITPAYVREFRDLASRLPTRWREREELRGLGMRDAADKADRLGLPRVTLITVNKYLSTLSPLFAWLIQNKWDIRNPCDGLFYPKVKGKNPRPPFTTDELNRIFTSPLFTGFLRNGAESKPGNVRADDWRYWLPLLAMFTSARIGEFSSATLKRVASPGSSTRM